MGCKGVTDACPAAVRASSLAAIGRGSTPQSGARRPDLDRNAAAIILVHNSVQQGLAQSLHRKQKGFYSINTLIADIRLQVFNKKDVQRFFNLGKQVAMNFVLIAQVIVGYEKANLDITLVSGKVWR